MPNLNQPFTVGKWFAKSGYEKMFITEWEHFAQWTAKTQPGIHIGYLLQNPERPQEFISFGQWENLEAITTWRERPEFKTFLEKANQLCDNSQPQGFRLVATSGELKQ